VTPEISTHIGYFLKYSMFASYSKCIQSFNKYNFEIQGVSEIRVLNLFQILNQFVLLFRKNFIVKSSMIWRVFPLVKINTRISETPCI
jgi:hypothetical protein